MSKKITLVFLYISIFTIKGYTQTSEIIQTNWNMTPQPPDVTTFSQYGNFPISYYTGTPQISIPLFVIRENDVEIPITLIYSGTGVRVSEQSSWVGLGWNLVPGGYITRIVNGDEYEYHLSTVYNSIINNLWDDGIERQYLRYNGGTSYFEVNENVWETEGSFPADIRDLFPENNLYPGERMFRPDIYSFSFFGYSGKFFLDPENNYEPVFLAKKNHFVIKKDKDSDWDPEQDGWEITLPNGIVVFFQANEKIGQSVANCLNSYVAASLTWKISKVKLLNGDEINFTYEDVSYSTASISESDIYAYEDDEDYEYNRLKEYQFFNLPFPEINCQYNRKPTPILNNLKVLTSISSPKYNVTFNCIPDETKPRLQSIEFYNKSNLSTKQGYIFNLEEFTKSETYWNQFGKHGSELTTGDEQYYIKYKLSRLQKYGTENGVTEVENPYEFYYTEDIGLPSILSFAQDYWGYYNGEHNNLGLIPDENQMYANGGYFPDNKLPDRLDQDLRARATANRGTSSDHMKQGTLNKIVYPTGGSSKFIFEPHTFYISDMSEDYLLPADQFIYNEPHYTGIYTGTTQRLSEGGGLRIKEIINYDSDDSFVSRKKYEYGESGLLLEPLHFWSVERRPQLVLDDEDERNLFLYKIWTTSGSNHSQSFLLPNPVGYSNVLELNSDREFDNDEEKVNGYVNYSFHNYETLYNPEISKITYNYLDTRNGLPRAITYSDNSGSVVKNVVYNYKRLDESMFLSMVIKRLNVSSEDSKLNIYAIEYTPLKCELWKEDYITTTENGVATKTTFDYSTDEYANVIKKEEESSKGEIYNLVTRYKFPLDYMPDDFLSDPPTSSHDESIMYLLCNRNIIDKAIETTVERNGKILGGAIMKYDVFPYVQNFTEITDEHIILPAEQYQLETANPIEVGSFTVSDVVDLLSLEKDESYKLKTVLGSYDNNMNLLEYHTKDGNYVSYIYGYHSTLAIAKVVNARTSNTALGNECSYIGFESNSNEENLSDNDYWFMNTNNGFSTDSRTGNYSRLVENEYSFSRTFEPENQNQKYKLSCWVKTESGFASGMGNMVVSTKNGSSTISYQPYGFGDTNGEWKYIEIILDLPLVKANNGIPDNTNLQVDCYPWNRDFANHYFLVDDVRFQPVSSEMNTYTYEPLVGITSSTDAKNYTTYYEYDNLGRLINIKDKDENILKEYKYNYSTPITPTSLSFPQSEGTQNLTVNTEKSWQITDLPSFISSVSPSSGMGKATVAVTCSVNSGTAARSGEMTFTYDGKTKTINISQETSLVTPSVTITSPTEGSYASLGNDDYLTINWNTNYEGNITIEIINNSIWYSFIQIFSSSVGNNSFDWYFVDDQGTTFEPGECVIMIYGDDSNVNDQVTFTLVE